MSADDIAERLARAQRRVDAHAERVRERDEIVREAIAAGKTNAWIAERAGFSRGNVDRIRRALRRAA
jgi:DNA-binding NarL/FixJ family response regulator